MGDVEAFFREISSDAGRQRLVRAIAGGRPQVDLKNAGGKVSIKFTDFKNTKNKNDIRFFYNGEPKTVESIRAQIVLLNPMIETSISKLEAEEKKKTAASYATLKNIIGIEEEQPDSYEYLKRRLIEKKDAATLAGRTDIVLDTVDDLVDLKKRKAIIRKLEVDKYKKKTVFEDKIVSGVLVQDLIDGPRLKALLQAQGVDIAENPAFTDVIHQQINAKAQELITDLGKYATNPDDGEIKDAATAGILYSALTDPIPRRPMKKIKIPTTLDISGNPIPRTKIIPNVDPLANPEEQEKTFTTQEAEKKNTPGVDLRTEMERIMTSFLSGQKSIEKGAEPEPPV